MQQANTTITLRPNTERLGITIRCNHCEREVAVDLVETERQGGDVNMAGRVAHNCPRE